MGNDIHIRGEVEVNRSPSLTQEHNAERKDDAASEKKKFVVEIITLLSVFLVAGLTFWQGCVNSDIKRIAQDTYEAADRPYVGAGLAIMFNCADKNIVVQCTPGMKPIGFVYQGEVKNYGVVPAVNFDTGWKTFVDGVELKGEPKVPSKPTTLYPTQSVFLQGTAAGDLWEKINMRQSTLDVEITVRYDLPSGQTVAECTREEYFSPGRIFAILGACTHR